MLIELNSAARRPSFVALGAFFHSLSAYACVEDAALLPILADTHNAKKGSSSKDASRRAEFTSQVPQKNQLVAFFSNQGNKRIIISVKKGKISPFRRRPRGNIQREEIIFCEPQPEQQIYLSEGWILRWMYPLNHSHCLHETRFCCKGVINFPCSATGKNATMLLHAEDFLRLRAVGLCANT